MMPKLLKTVRFRKHPILHQMKQMRLNQYPLFRKHLNLHRMKQMRLNLSLLFRKHPILHQMKQMRLMLSRRLLNLRRRKTAQKGRAMNSYPSRARFLTHRHRNLKNVAVSGEQLNPARVSPLPRLLPEMQNRLRKVLPVKMMIMMTMISA